MCSKISAQPLGGICLLRGGASSTSREVYSMVTENELLQSQTAVLGHVSLSALPGCTHNAIPQQMQGKSTGGKGSRHLPKENTGMHQTHALAELTALPSCSRALDSSIHCIQKCKSINTQLDTPRSILDLKQIAKKKKSIITKY